MHRPCQFYRVDEVDPIHSLRFLVQFYNLVSDQVIHSLWQFYNLDHRFFDFNAWILSGTPIIQLV